MESALINLRAELLRKKSEAKKKENIGSGLSVKHSSLFRGKKIESLRVVSNKNGSEVAIDENKEELSKLERSRNCLERKAALYDQIQAGNANLDDDDLNQRFLVNFQGKIPRNKSEESVAVNLDSSGQVLQEPGIPSSLHDGALPVSLTNSKGKSWNLKSHDGGSRQEAHFPESASQSEFLALEEKHCKWRRMEEEAKTRKNVHYGDVRFDEARTHGASFVQFSLDEEERAAQQRLLKELGTATAAAAEVRQREKRSRKKELERRLAKVRARKRLKMGLPAADADLDSPPASDEDTPDDVELPTVGSSHDHPDCEQINGAATTENNPESRSSVKGILPSVREWDLGKPGLPLMSQQEWVETRRKVRNPEFGPLQGPSTSRAPNSNRLASSKGISSTQINEDSLSKAPRNSSTRYSDQSSHSSDIFTFHSSRGSRTTEDAPSATENDSPPRKCSDFAPPSTYDYFLPSSSARQRPSKASSRGSSVSDMERSIERGLASLRKQAKKH